jgi:hypothetical protein
VIQHRKINKTKEKRKREEKNNNHNNQITTLTKKMWSCIFFIYQRNGNVRGRSAPSFTNGL